MGVQGATEKTLRVLKAEEGQAAHGVEMLEELRGSWQLKPARCRE